MERAGIATENENSQGGGYYEAQDPCMHCGKCCRCKHPLDDGREIADPTRACKYLKYDAAKDAHLCSIYYKRFRLNQNCMSAKEGVAEGLAPPDCPYRRIYPCETGNDNKLIVPQDAKAYHSELERLGTEHHGDRRYYFNQISQAYAGKRIGKDFTLI
jgi:uncharacterized cysteine cluster protein YcgN (CxxCxxCC family)